MPSVTSTSTSIPARLPSRPISQRRISPVCADNRALIPSPPPAASSPQAPSSRGPTSGTPTSQSGSAGSVRLGRSRTHADKAPAPCTVATAPK